MMNNENINEIIIKESNLNLDNNKLEIDDNKQPCEKESNVGSDSKDVNLLETENNEVNKDNLQETDNQDKKYKQLAFWVGLLGVFVVCARIILNSCGVSFEIKLAIEIVSYVLAFLVSIGVLKSSKKGKDINDLKEDIQNEILSSTNKNSAIKSDDTINNKDDELKNNMQPENKNNDNQI